MRYPNVSAKSGRRWGVYYYRLIGSFLQQDTSGATNDKAQAFGNAAAHVAKGELKKDEYAQALIIDRWRGKVIRSYRRNHDNSLIVRDL